MIETDIQSLSPSAIVELFVLDTSKIVTPANGGGIDRFHSGTNQFNGNVVWQGQTYKAAPIEAEGFGMTTRGTMPRPKIRIVNTDGLFSALVRENGDLVGATVTRKRTFVRYLDAVNFKTGNAGADPNQHFQDELWYVDQKVADNRYMIEWELSSALDIQGVLLPHREVIQNSCVWEYRGAECGYSGTAYFDRNDNVVGSLPLDFCGKRLSSCRKRFTGSESVPFGGFPGATRYGI